MQHVCVLLVVILNANQSNISLSVFVLTEVYRPDEVAPRGVFRPYCQPDFVRALKQH